MITPLPEGLKAIKKLHKKLFGNDIELMDISIDRTFDDVRGVDMPEYQVVLKYTYLPKRDKGDR